MIPELGRLTAVDLRHAWSSEAQNFTPWLARPENLAVLGESLDLELQVDTVEKPVGPYRADILCREAGSDRLVLIENQIEPTDHKHLGQLLTYAAGLDTAVICWLARRFTEEHRAVLDWLNEITDERFAFFGVEIELWQIGDSPPAPRFNIVAQPNEWRRAVAKGASRVRAAEPEGIDINRVAYWTAFEKALEERDGPIKPRGRPPRMGAYGFKMAPDVYLYAYRDVAKQEIGVFLGLYGASPRPLFESLLAARHEIEGELQRKLDWQTITKEKKYRIYDRLPQADAFNENEWNRQHAWLIQRLEAFLEVLVPRARVALAESSEGVPS